MSHLTPLPQSGTLAGGEPDPRDRARRRRRLRLAALVVVAAAGYGAWRAGVRPPRALGELFAPAPTATPTPPPASPTPTASPTATATPFAPSAGLIDPPPPFFRFGRPFDPPERAVPERSYPYGTNAEGRLLLHHGNDLGAPAGTEVRAIEAGVVAYAGLDSGHRFGPDPDFYGRLVAVRHDATLDGQALISLYGHLSSAAVRYGQRLARGDVLGTVGSEGVALGPHLHLEIRTALSDYAATRNPLLFLAPLPGTGAVVARVEDSLGRPLDDAMVGLFALDGGERWIAQSRTYGRSPVNRTAPFDEAVVHTDLAPGRYALSMVHHSATVRTEFEIQPDRVTFAVLAP